MEATTIKRIEQAALNLAEIAVDDYQQMLHNRLMARADAIYKVLNNEIGIEMMSLSYGYKYEWYVRKRDILYSKITMLHDLDWKIYEEFLKAFAK